jgi:hypothetical protein
VRPATLDLRFTGDTDLFSGANFTGYFTCVAQAFAEDGASHMQAPQTIKKNFIALLNEAAEEPGVHPSRPTSGRPLTRSVLALIAALWRRAHGAS